MQPSITSIKDGRWSMPANQLHVLLKQASALVRGPFFLSIVSLVLLLTIPAAQATLLKGYLEAQDQLANQETLEPAVVALNPELSPPPQPALIPPASAAPPAARALPSAAQLAPASKQQALKALSPSPGTLDESSPLSPAEATMQRRTQGLQTMLRDNSFPISFAGSWNCQTVVVASALATIPVGQRVQSQVHFVPQNDGRVIAQWEQPGWTEAQAHVVPINENEASIRRTNYFVTRGRGGSWAARSHDHYIKLDATRMAAESHVDQFVHGQFMGRYQTRSMLYLKGKRASVR